MPTREEMWSRLGESVDVLVVGGGINGAGIARDAARRGLKVALVEMKDLAYGTSSRSSKLVHGGLRYLEQFEFSLVFESVSERRILMDIAPHLVNPLGFIFPVYKGARRNLLTVRAGMWLYDGLSLFRSPKRHRKLGKDEVRELEPCLRTSGLKGAPLYYDCSTDDARLTLESALDAALNGATVCTWAKVTSFVKDASESVKGVVVEDVFTGETKTVLASAVVNATGPWTDRTMSLSHSGHKNLLRPTKGVHIVVEHDKLPVRHAVVCFHPKDKRVLFAIPWGDRTYLGTTDTDYSGDPGDVVAQATDVEYLLGAAAEYFPEFSLEKEDVISTWAGLRPLISSESQVDESDVSREHRILVGTGGVVTVAGGKLTTYRKMSAEVVDTVLHLLRLKNCLPDDLREARTDAHPLPGAVGWPPDDNHARVSREIYEVADGHLDEATCEMLTNTYGMNGIRVARDVYRNPVLATPLIEGRPEILAQVDWGVKQEMAATVTDILIQRTQVFYRAFDQGLSAAPLVSERMAFLLGWDEETRRRHVDQFTHDVALSQLWRTAT